MERPWSGRLPLIKPDDLDGDRREYAEKILDNSVPWAERSGFAAQDEDGHLMGPFTAFALSPTYSRGFNQWVRADQTGSSLPATVREVVILTVGTAWQAAYELYAHVAVARSVGLPEPVIDGIRAHAENDDFSPADLAAHRFTDQLVRTHAVDDETYAAALEVFDQQGVLDMVHLIGMYLATSAVLNAFDVPAPPIPDGNA